MEILSLIDNRKYHELDEFIKNNKENNIVNQQVNHTYPLWYSITGVILRLLQKNGKDDKKSAEILLKYGANPNKDNAKLTPLFGATLQNNPQLISLLILYGADPNNYSGIKMVKIEYEDPSLSSFYKKDTMSVFVCKFPLDCAIENAYFDCVDCLLANGAFYNDITLDNAKNIFKKLEFLKKKSYNDYERYKNMEKIIKLLEENYKEDKKTEMDNKIKNYINENRKIASYFTYFIGMERFKSNAKIIN